MIWRIFSAGRCLVAMAGVIWLLAEGGRHVHGEAPRVPLWPLLAGDIGGELTVAEGHSLAWSLALASPSAGVRTGELTVSGEGAMLRVALSYEPAAQSLRWRIAEGAVDLARWLPALATRFLPGALAGASASGMLELKGEGTLDDGVPAGRISASWRDGALAHAGQGWSLEAISLRAEGDVANLPAGRVSADLGVGTITTTRFGARNLAVSAALDGFEVASISSARVEIAGGRVESAPFRVALSAPAVDVRLAMERVGLADIVALVPEALAGASGRVHGEVRLGWSQAGGFTVGEGRIVLDPSEPAQVRFHPSPGLLTGSLPALVLRHYPGLARIETGQTPLLAERFEASFSPAGDAGGLSASVRIEGGPLDTSLKAPLVLTVNVRGPLEPLIRLGTGGGLGTGAQR